MLKLLAKLFGAKPKETAPAEVPYKVETPVANDQSQVIAAAEASATMTQPAETAVIKEVPAQVTAVAEAATEAMVKSTAKPKKKPAVNKPAAKKVDKTASVKKSRKPRQPKQA